MTGCHTGITNNQQYFAVTTSHRPTPVQVSHAVKLAAELSVPFIPRNDLSIESMISNIGIAGIMVISSQRISFFTGKSEFFFHPGLAKLRINELKNGKTDQMVQAMSLQAGDTLLDCTLGLGSDSIVASYVSGSRGRVTGLESSILIAAIVGQGLKTYQLADADISQAMQRVEVVHFYHKDYLAGLPPRSYDVVYFDPMFRSPRKKSPYMDAMRAIANPNPIDRETIAMALKACTKRVVMKERRWSKEFERLGFKEIRGGKHAPVVYGVIDRQVMG
ncbi:MAG: class I SAM-dependent methyltransferase [Desulfotomaculaceae bacterium]|nr:class I SAM-dependent methyltransferase [Desulfotomaculaceae bacterium]